MTNAMVETETAPATLLRSARTGEGRTREAALMAMESAALVCTICPAHELLCKQVTNVPIPLIYLVDINCGAMSNENCTYFESNSPTAGGCTATICPCNNDICQVNKLTFYAST